MTNVHVKLYEGDGTTLATGYVLATPTTRRDVTDGIALPVGKAYPLVAGEATMVLAPSGLTWCWEIREMTAQGTTRNISVVDSVDTLEYEDCPDVDPTTLLPWSPADPEAAYQEALDNLDVETAVETYLTENPVSAPVTSVNGEVGAVVLDAADVGAAPVAAAVPAGGADGQVLTKTSGADYTTAWETPSGGGSGVSVAKFKTSGGTTYPAFLPGLLAVSRDLGIAITTTTEYHPFTAYGDWNPVEFLISVTTTTAAAGAVMYAWLYAADEDWQPTGSPVLDITAAAGFALDSTGLKTISGFTTTIPAGNYVAIMRATANGATLRAYGLAAVAPASNLGSQFLNRPELGGVTDTTAPATAPKWSAAPSSNGGFATYLFWK